MELRARIRPLSRRAAFAAALVALLASAVAGAVAPSADAAKKKKKKAPVVTKVSPLDVSVGETLTLRGRNFVAGRKKNTVVFKRRGARAIFAKSDLATKKLLRVTVPATVQKIFKVKAGNPVPTRFRLRVLSRKFGKRFTKKKLSPVVYGPGGHQTAEVGDCDGDKVLNKDEVDDDNDLLNDDVEQAIGTNLCNADSDADTIEDGYEWQSAKDLNDDDYQGPNQVLPYPGKRPYPNPLFADAHLDYDGDSLTLTEEQALWRYTFNVNHTATRTLTPLSYSDGMQVSLYQSTGRNGRRVPAQPWSSYTKYHEFVAWASATGYLSVDLTTKDTFDAPILTIDGVYDIRDADLDKTVEPGEIAPADYDNDTFVSDDERDEDADGLSNYLEVHGPMLPTYWEKCYTHEKPFPIAYAGTDYANGDTDGDGVLDGADDQDHDDVPNLLELSRISAGAAVGVNEREAGVDCKPDASLVKLLEAGKEFQRHPDTYGRVNPFNPCLPFTDSRTCPRYASLEGAGFAPFDLSPNWFALQ